MQSRPKVFLYWLMDLLTLGRGIPRTIGGQSIRLPARWSRYYPADYEPATFEFLRQHCKKGSTTLDIGAHFGIFSVTMARLVGPTGRVFAFEPTPSVRSVLKDVVRLNGCQEGVTIQEEAVAAEGGMATFNLTAEPSSNANSLVRIDRAKQELAVRCVSIDEFLEARSLRVGCLKIDVEGAELAALRGGRRTFLECRPATRLSLHPAALAQAGQTLTEVWELIDEYRMEVRGNGQRAEKGWFTAQDDLFDVTLLPGL